MADPRIELLSITSTLDDLAVRIGNMAEAQVKDGDEEFGAALYEVERTLNVGRRRLARIVR